MNKYEGMFRKFSIHPLFWGVICIGVWTAHFKELMVLFMIVFFHELGHAAAATHYNWRIRRIQLLPFGGVVEMEEHGNKPIREEVIVILAGPAQHIWMVLLAYMLHENGWMSENAYTFFLWNNLSVFFINFLPVWPLDGGKLLFCIYSMGTSYLQAHRMMLVTSVIFVTLCILGGLLWNKTNITMWTMLVFLLISLYHEWKQQPYAFLRFLLERYYNKATTIRSITSISVNKSDPLFVVFMKFRRGYKHSVIIRGKDRQYILDENELLYAYFSEKRTRSSVGELIG
ncbi:M50 family metallopeptidase [Ectobacillus sp. sgz5001026]|uniref:M50 family metallopeptidase n=1 Tax=Ectobacillus sp. sgz5001026 TaxID=3242473 RepID=UPI0036D23A74